MFHSWNPKGGLLVPRDSYHTQEQIRPPSGPVIVAVRYSNFTKMRPYGVARVSDRKITRHIAKIILAIDIRTHNIIYNSLNTIALPLSYVSHQFYVNIHIHTFCVYIYRRSQLYTACALMTFLSYTDRLLKWCELRVFFSFFVCCRWWSWMSSSPPPTPFPPHIIISITSPRLSLLFFIFYLMTRLVIFFLTVIEKHVWVAVFVVTVLCCCCCCCCCISNEKFEEK